MKKITQRLTLFALLFGGSLCAQIINTAPYILTVDELKTWTSNGPTASTNLISTVPLASRFTNTGTQFNTSLNNDMQIAYLPDGMNNFGNYYGEQSQFNLYNFTHWAYIDKLVWFGGTSSQSVQIPSSPWVNAAHKNGVKVFGNIFFAPMAFGGSSATLQSFLEQDVQGNYVAVQKLIDIMQYYHFDGWFINEETATSAAIAAQMHDFVRDLTTAAETVGKEVMWYDAMRLTGAVGWQNRLNLNNSPFVQDDSDGDGTFETRVGSSIFINFFWGSASFPTMSRTRAQTIGRSQYDVFTGMDIWPGRNQGDFGLTGNNYMGYLHENPTTPYTSLGLFAPNCIYNHSQYSNFNNDPNDYAAFYTAENRMFAGDDQNPATVDATGWKGFSNWIPETSVVMNTLNTSFNTGHGFKKFALGAESGSTSWHDMNAQDLLPTWQWAFSPTGALTAQWDFEDAFMGGNSVKINGNLPAAAPVDLMLFKTKIPVASSPESSTGISLYYKTANLENPAFKALVVFADEPAQRYALDMFFSSNPFLNGWGYAYTGLTGFEGREIAAIGLRFQNEQAVQDYAINLGELSCQTVTLDTEKFSATRNWVTVTYPQNGQPVFQINWPGAKELHYTVVDVAGKSVRKNSIALQGATTHALPVQGMKSGVYVVKFRDANGTQISLKVLVK